MASVPRWPCLPPGPHDVSVLHQLFTNSVCSCRCMYVRQQSADRQAASIRAIIRLSEKLAGGGAFGVHIRLLPITSAPPALSFLVWSNKYKSIDSDCDSIPIALSEVAFARTWPLARDFIALERASSCGWSPPVGDQRTHSGGCGPIRLHRVAGARGVVSNPLADKLRANDYRFHPTCPTYSTFFPVVNDSRHKFGRVFPVGCSRSTPAVAAAPGTCFHPDIRPASYAHFNRCFLAITRKRQSSSARGTVLVLPLRFQVIQFYRAGSSKGSSGSLHRRISENPMSSFRYFRYLNLECMVCARWRISRMGSSCRWWGNHHCDTQ